MKKEQGADKDGQVFRCPRCGINIVRTAEEICQLCLIKDLIIKEQGVIISF